MTLFSIQHSECPQWYLVENSAINIIGGDVGVAFASDLGIVLVLASDFYHTLPVNAKISRLHTAIFNFMCRCCKLIAKESFAHCSYFGLCYRQCIQQIGIVKQNLVWLLQVANPVQPSEKPAYKGGFLKISKVL